MLNTDDLQEFLTGVADAIRTKKGTTEPIPAPNFDTEILSIVSGDGVDTSDATATEYDIISPHTAYAKDQKVIGKIIPTESDYIEDDLIFKFSSFTIEDIDSIVGFKIRKNILIYYTDTQIGLFHIDNPYVITKYNISELGLTAITAVDISSDDKRIIISNSNIHKVYLIEGITIKTESGYVEITQDYLNFNEYYANMGVGANGTYSSSSGYTYLYVFDEDALTYVTREVLGGGWYRVGKTTPQGPFISNYNDWYASGWTIHQIDTTGATLVHAVVGNTTYKPDRLLGSSNGEYINFSKGSTHNFRKLSISHSDTYRTLTHEIESMGYFSDGKYVFLIKSDSLAIYDIEEDKIIFTDTVELNPSNIQYFNMGDKFISLVNNRFKIGYAENLQQYAELIRSQVTYYNPYQEDAKPEEVLLGKTFINHEGRQTGTIPDNGELNYEPQTTEQSIPQGYTLGGTISPVTNTIDSNITPENIKSGVVILGVEGELLGIDDANDYVDARDATATEEDVLSPKTFYAGTEKRTGTIESEIVTISEDIMCGLDTRPTEYWISGICDKYGIAVVYVYNQQEPWFIYEWDGQNLGNVLMSLSSATYPGGTQMKFATVSKELNESGYLNIWCHATTSNSYSDDMRGYLGVLQYDIENNTIVQHSVLQTSKPGGYNRTWNENGNMSVSPVDVNKCFVSYYNKDRIYMQLLVYSPVENTLGRSSVDFVTDVSSAYSSEWSHDGMYVLVTANSKLNPSRHIVVKVNEDLSLNILVNQPDTRNAAIYKQYLILGNSIYDFNLGSLVQVKSWENYPDYNGGKGIIWTYQNYLFVVDYIASMFACFRITELLDLEHVFTRTADSYKSSSDLQYVGTALVPVSNDMLYFQSNKWVLYKMTLGGSIEKVRRIKLKGNELLNIEETTCLQPDVLSGKVFYNLLDGKTVGTMPDNGELHYGPMLIEQTLPAGYISGGIIAPVTSDIDINIVPENIKTGVTILGVEGTLEKVEGGSATGDANLQAKYLLEGYSAVVDDTLIEGTMKNYGDYTLIATSEDMIIPEGYYHSLSIPIIDASNCANYYECKAAINSI